MMPAFNSMMDKFSAWISSGEGKKFLLHDLPDALKVILALVTKIAQVGAPLVSIVGNVNKPNAGGATEKKVLDFLGFGDIADANATDKKNFGAWKKAHDNQAAWQNNTFNLYGDAKEQAKQVHQVLEQQRRLLNNKTKPATEH